MVTGRAWRRGAACIMAARKQRENACTGLLSPSSLLFHLSPQLLGWNVGSFPPSGYAFSSWLILPGNSLADTELCVTHLDTSPSNWARSQDQLACHSYCPLCLIWLAWPMPLQTPMTGIEKTAFDGHIGKIIPHGSMLKCPYQIIGPNLCNL